MPYKVTRIIQDAKQIRTSPCAFLLIAVITQAKKAEEQWLQAKDQTKGESERLIGVLNRRLPSWE